MTRVIRILVFCVVAASAPAFASPVLLQPPVWSGNGTNVGISWTSQTSNGSGYVAFDSFSFAQNTTINAVTWWGIYLNLADLTNGAPNTTRWDTLFFDDVAGHPNALVGGQIVNTTVQRTTVGTGLFANNPVTVYRFDATFPDFTALAGTTYWFAPVSVSNIGFDPLFSWIQGSGGDGSSFQAQLSNFATVATFVHGEDRAFALSTVPEPSTVGLLALGLGGLAYRRRRAATR